MASVASGSAFVGAGRPLWQDALGRAVRDPAELCRLLELPTRLAAAADAPTRSLSVLVPRAYLGRIRRGDPDDPLLKQVLPVAAELERPDGFAADPVGEVAAARSPGLLQKYRGRVLLITSPACGIHCRYCFRRHRPSSRPAPQDEAHLAERGERDNSTDAAEAWDRAVALIAADASVEEVILSGGDPLMLTDEKLGRLARRLARISHVARLRIHTRMPIVLPDRVTDELLAWLRGTRLAPVVVVHANHPRELGAEPDDPVRRALGRLFDAGVPVLNQGVLLRGVNDDVGVLAELCRRLIACRVIPYYLHQLDRVAGAAHFEVPPERGIELVRKLREKLPGYAVPRYVREVEGRPSKVVLA